MTNNWIDIRINSLSNRRYRSVAEKLIEITQDKELRGWSVFGVYHSYEFGVELDKLTTIADAGIKFTIPVKLHMNSDYQTRVIKGKTIMLQYRKQHKGIK